MAATTKLIVYNAALREIAAGQLASLSETGTALTTLNDAWDHAVEYALALRDWGFARRRATLSGSSNTTSFPPYIYQYTKPSDFLRKCWVKVSASDSAQIDHAEVAAVIYGHVSSALLEYVSDHSDNYNPANWPPHFTRVLTLYLAGLVAPRLARAGAGEQGMLDGKMSQALELAEQQEALFLVNTQIATNRLPVMRRALEFMGQSLSGSVAINTHGDMLRWHMNEAWDHALKYVLEQAAWNFATRRIRFTGSTEDVPSTEYDAIVEGYSVGPEPDDEETDTSSLPAISEFPYGFLLPDDFLHKIWVKGDANHDMECDYQFMRGAIYTKIDTVIMEYVALDDDSTDPTTWSANFLEVVAAYLALMVSPELVIRVNGKGDAKVDASEVRQKMEAVFMRKLSDAKLRDAIQQQTMKVPLGRFARSRMGSIGTTSVRRYN